MESSTKEEKEMIDNELKYVTSIKDKKRLGQVWTPSSVVKLMMSKVDDSIWSNPTKTFLDPTMGSGNIILNILENRIVNHKVKPIAALKTCYGIELDKDTLVFAKKRIKEYIAQFTNENIDDILKHNFVHSNFFDWDIENWRKKKSGGLHNFIKNG